MSDDQGATAPEAPPTTVWWRRPGWLLAGAVVVIVAITVVTDLPQSATKSVQLSGDTTVVQQVNASIRSCAAGAKESFEIYRDEEAHSLTATERSEVPSLLRDDQSACSFTDEDIYNLSSIEVPGSAAGAQLQHLVSTVTDWATADALKAIEAIQTLTTQPGATAARASLSEAEGLLQSDRSLAIGDISTASHLLGGRLPSVGLPALSSLVPPSVTTTSG